MNKFIGIVYLFCFSLVAVDVCAGQKKADDVFGFDVNGIAGPKVIKILKDKKIKYALKSEVEDSAPDPKNPDVIITTLYIGRYLDSQKMKAVVYEFPPFGGAGNAIEMEIMGGYHDALLKKLINVFGVYESKKDQKGENYLYWEMDDKDKYHFHEIFLSGSSLFDLPDRSKTRDIYYLYMRGQEVNRGPAQ